MTRSGHSDIGYRPSISGTGKRRPSAIRKSSGRYQTIITLQRRACAILWPNAQGDMTMNKGSSYLILTTLPLFSDVNAVAPDSRYFGVTSMSYHNLKTEGST